MTLVIIVNITHNVDPSSDCECCEHQLSLYTITCTTTIKIQAACRTSIQNNVVCRSQVGMFDDSTVDSVSRYQDVQNITKYVSLLNSIIGYNHSINYL